MPRHLWKTGAPIIKLNARLCRPLGKLCFQIALFDWLLYSASHRVYFLKTNSKFIFSETIRRMKLKLGFLAYVITLYKSCVFVSF